MTSNPLPPGKRQPGSVGIGQGVEVAILDGEGNEVPQGSEAEICIRGENVTKGYLNNPEANKSSFTKGGFFRTGDQGKKDKDGYVIITGRIKELINKGGEKISPIELDNVVAQHQAVGEAVSFAIPDEMYGQEVALAVVLKDGQEVSEEALRSWIREKVAEFKVPKKIYFTGIMPKTATGEYLMAL
jgi:oxalate---CoA ligase